MAGTAGLVGIGLMGTAIARRLLGAGFAVVGFDIDVDRRRVLEVLGGRAAVDLGEVAGAAEHIVIAVMTTDQVEAVLEGPDGLLAALSQGARRTVLCASTCDPDRIAALAARLAGRGVAFLDTPVSGTSQQVAQGDGLGLIAGDPTAVKEADDILDAIYPRRCYVGPAGDGSKAKLAINLILGLNRMALAEGLVFAERLGLDARAFLDVARASAAYSQIMDIKGDKMVAGDYLPPQGKIAQGLKDVKIMVAEAARRGQPLPLASVLLEALEGCVAHGQADWDNSSIIEEVRRRTVST